MNSSNVNYISVSSPHTYNMNKIHVPPKVLMPPVFQPAKWELERSSSSSLEDSQESDSESLAEERQYQQGLKQRILENEELLALDLDDILGNGSLEEDSLEEMSSDEKGAECDKSAKGKQKIGGIGRKKQPVDKYSNLRYNPHWKSTKKGAEFLKAEKASQVSGGSSGDFSSDSFYLHSDDSSEKDQQEAKTQDSLSEFGPELFSLQGANVVASSEPVGPQAKRRDPADGFGSKDNPGWAFPPQIQQTPPQRAKTNFVKKNKRTLGLHSEKRNSYLELHNKKRVLQGQVTDPTPVDEKPLQSVTPFQTGKMKPEDKWNPKGQQLKEQHKFSPRNKMESNQTLSGRVFSRNDGQQPPGRAADPNSWHHSHLQTPGFLAVPTAGEQDSSRALQEYLNPRSSRGPDPAEKSKIGLNNPPNSIHPDLTLPTSSFPPIFGTFNPAEVLNPEYPSKESRKQQHDSPHGIPQEQQHSTSLTGYLPYFSASFEGRLKDQAPHQDFKNHIHEDNSSPTASCGTLTEMMEQHHPGMAGLRGGGFADSWLWSLLPPALSQLQGDSLGYPGENPGKMWRSSSEGSLPQMGKQNQPRASKKLCSKFYINPNMKLGGLGPDYEAVKEKKQKLELQKEYSRQIKEYNMKNITVVQSVLPTKPQVSSVSRQKALEYAKKIPRPKTYITRHSDQVGKEEKAANGIILPKIPSLETLWNRHEKEKEVVAAFEALHIL